MEIGVQDSLWVHRNILLLSPYWRCAWGLCAPTGSYVTCVRRLTCCLAQAIVVVVRVGAVVATAQLHGHIFVGIGHALYAQQRRACCYMQ